MALNHQSRLNYDGYDPAWVIGSGKPPPVHPAQTMGANRPVAAAPPSYASVQANGPAPGRGLPPHTQPLHHVQPNGSAPGRVLPPHTQPLHHVQPNGPVPGRVLPPSPHSQPQHHVQAERLVPGTGLPHTQPRHQGLGQVKHVQISPAPVPAPAHGGVVYGGGGGGVPSKSHHRQSHAQKIGKSLLGFMAQSQVTGLGKPRSASHPRPRGDVRSNPNPYLQSHPVVHAPIPAMQPAQRSAVHGPGVHTPIPIQQVQRSAPHGPAVHAHVQEPIMNVPILDPAPVVRVKGSAKVPAIPLRDVPVNTVVKVVMWVPLCCEACEKKWKDKVTDLPGFQGFDVERSLDRVSVFGHVVPSVVLATMQKVVPRTQMWRH